MSYHHVKLMFATIFAVMLTFDAAFAQYMSGFRDFSSVTLASGNQQTVTAAGTASVKRKPTALRMYLELLAKGGNLEEAMKTMKQRRDNALAQLKTLKADSGSIVFEDPGLSGGKSSRQRQVEAMMAARMQSRGKKSSKASVAPPVVVSVMLSAQWTMAAESPEQMLLLVQNLQEKIKAADLAGSKEAEKLTPEEEELAEESAQMGMSSDEQQVPPGQPYFLFVAKISKEDGEKLLAEAFAKAKTQAAELAKAADVELGPLTGLSGQYGGQYSFGEDEYGSYNNNSGIRRMLSQLSAEGTEELRLEAMNNTPTTVSFRGYVQANFRLGK